MKRRIIIAVALSLCLLLLVSTIFRITGSPAELSIAEANVIKTQIKEEYKAQHGRDMGSIIYITSQGGYHVVLWTSEVMLGNIIEVDIAGYSFSLGGSVFLQVYKNGSLLDLKTAYSLGLVSKKTVARAHEIIEAG